MYIHLKQMQHQQILHRLELKVHRMKKKKYEKENGDNQRKQMQKERRK